MVKSLKDRPLFEITLRKYEKPGELDEREVAKRMCLSLGLLQPGDSRDIIIDILLALLKASSQKIYVSSKEVENFVFKYREQNKLPLSGITPSNINRQLRRIKDTGIAERTEEGFRIREFLSLTEVFDEYFLPHVLDPLVERIRTYLREADRVFDISSNAEDREEEEKTEEQA